MIELDIWRTATVLIKQHGKDALSVATRRAEELRDLGDAEGCSVWNRIRQAITQLEQTAPTQGQRVN